MAMEDLPRNEAIIARLFTRLSVAYGSASMRALPANMPVDEVRRAWAHELRHHLNDDDGLHRIAWACENLPPDPPNLVQLHALVRQAPRPTKPPQLPAPVNAQELAEKAGAMVAHLRGALTTEGRNGRAWLHDLARRAQAGERLSMAQRDALRNNAHLLEGLPSTATETVAIQPGVSA